jgi:predicted nucleotide-binding protein (sugar kinase/HSP70/actin superfamily)
MKISFPYMGTVLVYKKLLQLLGHEVIIPPRPTKRTIDLGVKYSPEFACFPFKVIMGTYIEACEMGVDTIVSSGGFGPCRAGFYGEIHRRILKSLGYDIDLIILDQPLQDKNFLKKVKFLKGNNSWLDVIKAVKFTYRLIQEIDRFEKEIYRLMPYETEPGQAKKAWNSIQAEFDQAIDQAGLERAKERSLDILKSIKVHEIPEKDKIRIGIVGEIYVVMEPSINMDMEELLCKLGCEVERSQYLSEWVDHNLLPNIFKKSRDAMFIEKGKPYIGRAMGGHAQQSVGAIVDFKDRNFDGIIHLMPFACLPELISQSIIPRISKEHNIPVLTLAIDEQTGQTNALTRIEAFIDLVRNKKASVNIA